MFQRRTYVHSLKARMSMGTSHESYLQHAWHLDVVHVAALAQEHAWVLHPFNLRTNHFPCSGLTNCHKRPKQKKPLDYRFASFDPGNRCSLQPECYDRVILISSYYLLAFES
jgi:hypothetical protein